TDAGRRYVQTCLPIGTHVPHRHAVCRSYWLIYQGDKQKTAPFVTQEYVPICADAGIAQICHGSGVRLSALHLPSCCPPLNHAGRTGGANPRLAEPRRPYAQSSPTATLIIA